MLASSRGALDVLRDLVIGHGITTITRLSPDDEVPAIRSLLQLDGDLVVSLHPDALGDPRFEATWHRHWLELAARLATVPQAAAQLRALTRSAGLVAGGMAALFGHGSPRFVLAIALPAAAFVAARDHGARPVRVRHVYAGAIASGGTGMRSSIFVLRLLPLMALSACRGAVDPAAVPVDASAPADASAPDAPSGSCPSTCASGDTRCSDAGIDTCMPQSNGCLDWEALLCPFFESCVEDGGSATCVCPATPACNDHRTTCVDGRKVSCAPDDGACWGIDEDAQCALGCYPDGVSCNQIEEIAAGEEHMCARAHEGTVHCWGSNQYGQLGNGEPSDALHPTTALDVSPIDAIGLGAHHSCAVDTSGRVMCWGRNDAGQLGDGTTTDRATAVGPPTLSAVRAIAGGRSHTCALRKSGTVACWGSNASGQLGDGSNKDSPVPVEVPGVFGALSIVGGAAHTCVRNGDATIRCWGDNTHGQLGDGTTVSSSKAVTVRGLTGAASLASSSVASHTCATTLSGDLWCWGDNSAGQLGDGTTNDAHVPRLINGSPRTDSVAAGADVTCAISGSAVSCWGSGYAGAPTARTPAPVAGLAGAFGVATGASFACALLARGDAVDCWGVNTKGQLGNGTLDTASAPAPVR